jgi:acetyl esterase
MTLHPEIRQLVDETNAASSLLAPPVSVDDVRTQLSIIRRDVWKPERLPVGAIEEISIPGPDDTRIALRIYRPKETSATSTVLYLHGGAFMAGDLDSHESHARRIVSRLGAVVVAVDYRLMPENPFPAGYDDVIVTYRWVVANIDSLGNDAARIAVAGDSAGGNLAAAAALVARDEGLPLAAQLLAYPALDMSTNYASMAEYGTGYLISMDTTNPPWKLYPGVEEHASDTRVSPLLADLSGVAPAVIIVGEYDPLKDHAAAYARKLEQASVRVIHREVPGMTHSFMSIGASKYAVAETNRLIDDLGSLLQVPRPQF